MKETSTFKNWEGSEILPHLQANSLVCQCYVARSVVLTEDMRFLGQKDKGLYYAQYSNMNFSILSPAPKR